MVTGDRFAPYGAVLSRRAVFVGAGAALTYGGLAVSSPAFAKEPEIYLKKGGAFSRGWDYALDGYDTVSYHLASGPVKGSDQYSTVFKGATHLFASQENLDLFLADPDKYRPAYGGYCAYAIAVGNGLAHGDPKHWTVHTNGVLYLNYSAGIKRKWLKKVDEYIAKSDPLWPGVLGA